MPELKDIREVQENQQSVEANAPIDLVPSATVDTSHPLFQFDASAARRALDEVSQRTITPPSEANITKNMWLSSFMVGLSAALASGNAAGGITAGLWAAIAVHDGGYALRQRSEHVDDLLAKGYSFPAVLKWYEDGDNKDLEAEYKEMGVNARDALNRNEKIREFDAKERRAGEEFAVGQLLSREQMANQMLIAQMHERGADARAAKQIANPSLSSLNALGRGIYKPFSKQLGVLGSKQNYLDQLVTNIRLLREGNPTAKNALLTAVAGVDNPNISPREGGIHRIEQVGGLSQQVRDWLSGKESGIPTEQTLKQFESFAKAHQGDVDKVRQRIYEQAYEAASQYVNPAHAKAVAFTVAGGAVDMMEGESLPVTTGQPAPQPTSNSDAKEVSWGDL